MARKQVTVDARRLPAPLPGNNAARAEPQARQRPGWPRFRAVGPHRLWEADVTYVPTAAGLLFLAVVLDAWSRRIVGWAMATDLRTRPVLEALDMAATTKKPAQVVHHLDQCSQYTSVAFGLTCREAGVRPSSGSIGNAYDNAMAENN